jgi:hypothetical protein
MSGDGSIFNLSGPLSYGDCPEDAFAGAAIHCMMRAPDLPLRAKVSNQLFF